MRRKLFATVVTLALCVITLVGCGSSTESSALNEEAITPASADIVEETSATNAETDDISYGLADVTGENDDFGHMPEDECVPWDTESTEEEVVSETGEVEGIIVLQGDWRDQSVLSYTVYAVNPDTGVSQKISHFALTNVNQYNSDTIQPAWRFSRYANLYDYFSSDYTKIAATHTILSSGEVHAGWLDTAGNFYDVTVALGEQAQSDFDEPATYHAVGFQDDLFIYVHSNDKQEDQYYGVPLDNIAPGASFEIDPTDKLVYADWRGAWNWMIGYKLTDWLDDDHALVETMQSTCRIATISTQTFEEYLPGESTHHNWSAVANPDGTKVAFISRPISGTESRMYICSISGEDPVRFEPDFMPIFQPQAADKISSGTACCYILEWR